MMRKWQLTVAYAAVFFAMARPAYAADDAVVPPVVGTAVGAAALVIAIVLLVDVLALRRVAEGAAIAESIMAVVAAVVRLASSVLTNWVARFVPGVMVSGFQLLGDFFVLASMAFFAFYFYRVRRALQRFLGGVSYPMPEDDALASAQSDAPAEVTTDEAAEGGEGA